MTDHIRDFLDTIPTSADALAKRLSVFRFADAIYIVNRLDFDDAILVFIHLPLEYAIELFDKPELQRGYRPP